ncbi:MAG: TonB-dependent receptor [Zhongshania sp.]|nr:TonB-dependent receptor [Zhongshania sp.]
MGEEDRSLRSKLLFDVSDKTSIVMSALYADRESDVGIARQPAEGTVATGGGTYTGDFQDINTDWEPIVESSQRVLTFQLTHAFNAVELIATSAFSDLDAFTLLDQDSGPSHVVNFVVGERSQQLSQEFQFNSTGDGPLKWTAGLFFMSAESKNAPTQTTSANPAFNINMDTQQDTTSYAAYAQGTYDLTDATALTLGLRWTMDEREFSGRTTSIASGAPINPAMPVLKDDESWE